MIDSNITFDGYNTYPSAFLVIDPNGIYSKHYYAGTQRIVSRLGDDNAHIFSTGANRPSAEKEDSNEDSSKVDETAMRNVQVNDLKAYLKDFKLGTVSFKEYKASTYEEEEALLAEDLKENREEGDLEQERAPVSAPVYFYHPDHLGSSTFLTDANGNPYQFFINLPFGETMAEQLPDTYYRTPFKFNGKELDEETGLYYYGARYYDPKISIWLSVDPLVERFPATNPYVYCFDNPINMVDPDGRSPLWIFIFDNKGNMTVVNDGNSNILFQTSKGTFAPSKVDNSRSSLKGLAKIAAHFAGSKWFAGRPVRVTTKNNGSAGAHYDRNDDSMTLYYNAFKTGIYDNANNLKSTLNHEIGSDGHRGEKRTGNYRYIDHANIYLNETKSTDFSGTNENYKYSVAFGFAQRVFNAKVEGEIGSNEERSIIKNFNSNTHGINIDYKSWNGEGSATISIGGKTYLEKDFKRLKEPEN